MEKNVTCSKIRWPLFVCKSFVTNATSWISLSLYIPVHMYMHIQYCPFVVNWQIRKNTTLNPKLIRPSNSNGIHTNQSFILCLCVRPVWIIHPWWATNVQSQAPWLHLTDSDIDQPLSAIEMLLLRSFIHLGKDSNIFLWYYFIPTPTFQPTGM